MDIGPALGAGLSTVGTVTALATAPSPGAIIVSGATYAAVGGAVCLLLGGRVGFGLVGGIAGGFGASAATGTLATVPSTTAPAGVIGAAALAAALAYVYPGRRR